MVVRIVVPPPFPGWKTRLDGLLPTLPPLPSRLACYTMSAEDTDMFIVPFAAAMALLAPSYTLDYEIQKVGIAPDSEPQFARYTMRSESDSKLGARRLTML